MWIDFFEKNEFLRLLYPNDPILDEVSIQKFEIGKNGLSAKISFIIPLSENIPNEWNEYHYNTTCIDIEFFDIKEINLCISENINDNDFSKIIFRKKNDFIKMTTEGSFYLNLESKIFFISKISGVQSIHEPVKR